MADIKDIKAQRDRFLAFSFASADLLLEVSEAGLVTYALGAGISIAGLSENKLLGRPWLELFSSKDQPKLTRLRGRAQTGQRCGPLQVHMEGAGDAGGGRTVIVTGMKMPGSDSLYLTVGFMSELMSRMAHMLEQQESFSLLDKDSFLYVAREALDIAKSMGQEVDMTLLDIPETQSVRERLGEEWWGKFTDTLTDVLGASSVDGQSAAMLKDGRYSVIHDRSISSEQLRAQLEALAREQDPEGQGVTVESKTVSADLKHLSEREATKALIYTINEFDRNGTALGIDTLNSSFKTYVTTNAHKIQQFKTMVDQLNFDLHFQPIVDLDTLECGHFEMLARFKGEMSTQEWIVFGEDIGMAADFDIAVCERAINYLLYKSQGRRTQFAINLSGQSMQNEQFFKTLLAKLALSKELSDRLLFEITESTNIQNLEMVNNFIRVLQGKGYKVCLDDFGAGSASFQYLHALHVDYVKIDGQYTRKIMSSERDLIMVKNLTRMCNDLRITVIAEQIEKPDQYRIMRELGVPMGQGYLFGKATSKPEYVPANVALWENA